MIRCLGAVIALAASVVVSAELGIDLYPLVAVDGYRCLLQQGYSFVVPRGYRSLGKVDDNVCANLENARAAGVQKRDVYIFPCTTCELSATRQMKDMVDHINANCREAWSGRVWLDIEGAMGEYWLETAEENMRWYEELADSCRLLGLDCGVYTNKNNWLHIFGTTEYVYGNDMPLWYAHYDNDPSFQDFSTFGGWTAPYAKQYAGLVPVCGYDVDTNYATAW